MKAKHIILACLLLFAGMANTLQAQEDRNRGIIESALRGLEYEVRAGFNIGGATPLPLPQEIRALTGYSPNINLALEGDIIKWLGKEEKWGFIIGLRLETKGMEAEARTKNYSMEIIGDGGERMSGNWTGMVKTKYRASYFSVPVLAALKVSDRVRLSAGPYVSFKTSGDFSGHVFDGYLREGDPTGNKVVFEGESIAPYDFSDELRTLACLQAPERPCRPAMGLERHLPEGLRHHHLRHVSHLPERGLRLCVLTACVYDSRIQPAPPAPRGGR